MATGREVFRKYYTLIKFFSALIPGFALRPLTYLFDASESKFALFLRYLIIRRAAEYAGRNVFIGRSVVIKSPSLLSLGENISLHAFCYIDAAGGIEIGNNVSIAHSTSILSFDHTWKDLAKPIKYNPTKCGRVVISNDVWVGCGVRILAGTFIEERVVVAAGAVVKGRLESGFLYGGVPARKLRPLN